MKRTLLALLFLFSASACAPKLRLAPGQLPVAEPPPVELKSAAEGYVAAHIDEGNYHEIKSGAQLERVKRVVERLSRGAGFAPRTFPVHLVDAGEEVNAAAFNGASIVVYRALVERVRSDDDIATVLGHEIGHILAKHYQDEAEEQRRSSAVSIGSSLLGTAASIATSAAGYGGAADIAGSATEGVAGVVGYGAFVGSFNRTQEYEADHLGLMIMAKAGYNPEHAVDFWLRSKEIFGSEGSSVGAFFSTHPASGDRVDALREAMPLALGYYQGGDKTPAPKVEAKKSKKK